MMETTDGFRRRAAFAAHDRKLPVSSCHQTATSHQGSPVKFNKLNTNNHAILNSRKRDQEFNKTIQDISKRKCTFYRMGFRSYQKQGQKKIFSEVLGLSSGQMKGTMFVGQLWPNHQVGRFLRQNKIFVTKLKLMDKMQVLKKEYQQVEKSGSESQIGAVSTRSFGTLQHISPKALERQSNSSSSGNIEQKKIEFRRKLDNISGQLKKLKKTTSKVSLSGDLRYLENCKENIDRMEQKYFLKMIDFN